LTLERNELKANLDAKAPTNQDEERLTEQIKELMRECNELKAKVQEFKREEKESKEGWKSIIKDQIDQSRKRCEDMANCLQDNATNLAIHVYEANEEVNAHGTQLPWKTFKLMRFCEDLIRNFM